MVRYSSHVEGNDRHASAVKYIFKVDMSLTCTLRDAAFCLQFEASCLQWSLFTYSCVWELFCLQFELFCLQLKLFAYNDEIMSNKHLNGLQAEKLNCKQKVPTVSKKASPLSLACVFWSVCSGSENDSSEKLDVHNNFQGK